MKGVFDTNILVDFLAGESRAAATLDAYEDKVISRVTWMEVLVGVVNGTEDSRIRTFLSQFRIVDLIVPIAEAAVQIRRAAPKIKLPDAIIYATAKSEGCELITRDIAAFSPAAPDVIVPYTI